MKARKDKMIRHARTNKSSVNLENPTLNFLVGAGNKISTAKRIEEKCYLHMFTKLMLEIHSR